MKTKIERITLVHISDVHLSPVIGLSPRHWNLKRLLGFANWRLKRANIHQRAVVDELTNDMRSYNPDHIVVTGDLVNLGLPQELTAAQQWLTGLGPARCVTTIPGNHDIYTGMRKDQGVARWTANMCSNGPGATLIANAIAGAAMRTGAYPATMAQPHAAPIEAHPHVTQYPAFPFCRVIGPLALIGLNSAVPTPPFIASGLLGPHQLDLLANILDEARAQGLARIILIHHPPLTGQAPRRHGLRDAADLEKVLKNHGAELVLHGHNHRDSTNWFKGSIESTPVIGVASGSAAKPHHDEPLARYNIIRIFCWNKNVRIDITGRGKTRPGEPMSDTGLQSFQAQMP